MSDLDGTLPMGSGDRAALARECDALASRLAESAKALREAAKAIMMQENAMRMLDEAEHVRRKALDLLSVTEGLAQ